MMSFTRCEVPFLRSGKAAVRKLPSPTWGFEDTTCLKKMAFVVLFYRGL
jgi:hypothetical protein